MHYPRVFTLPHEYFAVGNPGKFPFVFLLGLLAFPSGILFSLQRCSFIKTGVFSTKPSMEALSQCFFAACKNMSREDLDLNFTTIFAGPLPFVGTR